MTLKLENSNEFIDALSLLISKQSNSRTPNKKNEPYVNIDFTFKLGKVPSTYTTGRPSVVFEGESAASLKVYPYLSSYTPTANDWVLLARVSNSYIILGKIL